jgi:hypothetical protein
MAERDDRPLPEPAADAQRKATEETEATREYTTPERARMIREPRGAPVRPEDHPDWRSRAAGTSRPESPGPARGTRGRDEEEEESLRRQAEAGLADTGREP